MSLFKEIRKEGNKQRQFSRNLFFHNINHLFELQIMKGWMEARLIKKNQKLNVNDTENEITKLGK